MRAPIVKNSPRFATYLALRLATVAMVTAAVLALGLLAGVLLPLIRGLAQAQFQTLVAEVHAAMERTFVPVATHLNSLALRRPLERFARPMPAAELVAWWQERSAIPAS